jgi:hypothetical protein
MQQQVRGILLLIGVLALGVLAVVLNELNLADHLSFETHRLLVYLVFLINATIAIVGMWTSHRIPWAAYLILSIACFTLVGASTPISGFWILAKVL